MLKKLFLRISLLALGLAVIWALLTLQYFSSLFHIPIHALEWFFIVWFPVITLISIGLLYKSLLQNNPKAFVRTFMMSMMLRMILSLLILIALVFVFKSGHIKPHIYFFSALYFSYFIFDVLAISRLLKSVPKN